MYRFDDARREIRFDDYRTPTPWMNYLSNGTLHAMISQAGDGVAFYRSPQIWRINHYRFFHLPMDRSGFYTYIRDGEDVWCPTCEPCPQKPEKWMGYHGMGYTGFSAEKNGLAADLKFLIGPEENAMIWELTLQSKTDRKIEVFPYVELGMMEFMRELQWQCYNKHQLSCHAQGDVLIYKYGVENQPKSKETPLVFFACDMPVLAYDCDRDSFVGSYRSEENPQGLEQDTLGDSNLYGGDPCFALQIPVTLQAGVPVKLHVYLGTAMTEEAVAEAVASCRREGFTERASAALKQQWDRYLSGFQCRIPDADSMRMINIWNPYQVDRNFLFSRNISYYATGTFRGVGMRDTAQDILAMIPLDTGRAREKLSLLFTQQYQDGHCNHYFFPVEGWEPVTRIHSDNHLWLIMDVYHLVMEEGDLSYLDERIPYYDGGEASVWEHIRQSVAFTVSHMGEHGFPLMLSSDWNDMLYKVCRKGKGESIWTSMQFGTVLRMMEELADLLGEDTAQYRELYETQRQLVNTVGWDGAWYRRCITDEGRMIGSDAEPQAKIWLNTQSWSVISGMGDPEKQRQAMDSVKERLNTELGIRKIDPAMADDYPTKGDPLTYYNKGCGENGSVFCHANTWAIIAECMLGRADRAYEYYHQLLPMIASQKAGIERYRAEPYVYSSNIFGPESSQFGLANVSWLTGTAAWMYLAVTQYMFGIRPTWKGLSVKPCLSSEMLPAIVTRRFRGNTYRITIKSNEEVSIEKV